MYILKNALKNIGRNIGRNSLLLLLVLFIISMSGISMLLKNHANKSSDYYTLKYGSKVSILPSGNEQLDKQVLLSFSESSLLAKSEFLATAPVLVKGLKVIDGSDADLIKWTASSKEKSQEAFESGEKKLVEGTECHKEDDMLVSKRFAQLNDLKIGDQITFTSKDGKEAVVLKISGIYTNVGLRADENPGGTSYSNIWNEVFTSFQTMKNSSLFDDYANCSSELYLKDPLDISKLRKELIAKGMPESYILSQDLDTYEQKMQPVRQLQVIAGNMLKAGVGVGGILLILVSIMAIRERKYEVGVLRSIGMTKGKIARGFIYESVIITMIALAISLSATTLLARPITNFVDHETIVEQSDILLSKDDVKQCIIISLAMVLISSTSGLFVIMRYEPRRILSS